MASVKKDDEKGFVAKAVDKVLHPNAEPDSEKPKKKSSKDVDVDGDFKQHPKFNKFKKGV